ncbi:MAG: tol-pal system protein YbgF [Desulfovibrio sp.]
MNRISLPLLLTALLLISGCAATSGSTKAASQEWRLQSLEESFLDFQEAQRQEAQRSQAADEELSRRLARLEERVSAILGGGSDLPPEQGKSGADRDAFQEMRESKVIAPQGMSATDAPEPRIPVELSAPETAPETASGPETDGPMPAPVLAGPESNEEKPWADVPGPALEARTRQPAPTATAPVSSAPQSAPMVASAPRSGASGASAQSQYDKGLNLVRSGRSEQGRTALERFLREHSGHKLTPNALYWIGESWYGEKNYPQAILSFKDVVAKYPKHSKAQAALLKIGMSYRNVGDKDNAVFYLRTLVDDHPGSEPAKMAEQLLREIPN